MPPEIWGQLRERGTHGQQRSGKEDPERREAEGPVQRQGTAILVSGEKSPLQQAYMRLLDLHTVSLLKHGPEVSQGVALAIKEVLTLMPDAEKAAALEMWAEGVPGELISSPPTTP